MDSTTIPKVGDYVVPDGWPNGIGALLTVGHEPIGAPWNYGGSPFCIQGQHSASPINITITGRLVNYRKFSRPAMRCLFTVTLRYDDVCHNGHNTFSITGELWRATKDGRRKGRDCLACGCLHDDIAKHFPELAHVIPWHGVTTDGPLHYLANTLYHVQRNGHLEHARRCAIWPDATENDLLAPGLEDRLLARLPILMQEFQATMEALGFTY